MSTKSAVNVANGFIINTTVSSVHTIPTSVDRFQIAEALIHNSGSSIRTVDIYILQAGQSVSNATKVVTKKLGVNESFLLLQIIGMSINTSGSIQAVVDSGTDVAIFITGTEFST